MGYGFQLANCESSVWVVGESGDAGRYTAGICIGSAYVFEMWESASLVTLLNVFSLWCVNYGAVATWLNCSDVPYLVMIDK